MDLARIAELKAKRLKKALAHAHDPEGQMDLNLRLLDAAQCGKPEDVARWIALGADATFRDPLSGLSPLMAAVCSQSKEKAFMLLPRSDLESVDNNGNTAGDWASKMGLSDIELMLAAFCSSKDESCALDRECSPPIQAPPRRFGL